MPYPDMVLSVKLNGSLSFTGKDFWIFAPLQTRESIGKADTFCIYFKKNQHINDQEPSIFEMIMSVL